MVVISEQDQLRQHERSIGIKTGENFAIWRTPLLSHGSFQELNKHDQLEYLVHLAHMAASTHNTQPWAFKLYPDPSSTILVILNRERVLSGSDAVGRQAGLSVGWAITNLEIASKYLGFNTVTDLDEIDPEKVKPLSRSTNQEIQIPIAEIRLTPTKDRESIDKKLYQALFSRRVDRRRYDAGLMIEDTIVAEIKSLIPDGIKLHLFKRGDPRITVIAELQGQADGYVANNPAFADELGQWMQFNNTDSYLGMPGDTFNLTAEQTAHIVKGFRGEEPVDADNLAGFVRGSRRGIESAAIVGMLTSTENNPQNWIKSGIVLGYIGLTLERSGISMAIHAGLAEAGEFNFQIVSLALSGLIGNLREKPIVLFRAGYPDSRDPQRPPHSPRLPIEQVLI